MKGFFIVLTFIFLGMTVARAETGEDFTAPANRASDEVINLDGWEELQLPKPSDPTLKKYAERAQVFIKGTKVPYKLEGVYRDPETKALFARVSRETPVYGTKTQTLPLRQLHLKDDTRPLSETLPPILESFDPSKPNANPTGFFTGDKVRYLSGKKFLPGVIGIVEGERIEIKTDGPDHFLVFPANDIFLEYGPKELGPWEHLFVPGPRGTGANGSPDWADKERMIKDGDLFPKILNKKPNRWVTMGYAENPSTGLVFAIMERIKESSEPEGRKLTGEQRLVPVKMLADRNGNALGRPVVKAIHAYLNHFGRAAGHGSRKKPLGDNPDGTIRSVDDAVREHDNIQRNWELLETSKYFDKGSYPPDLPGKYTKLGETLHKEVRERELRFNETFNSFIQDSLDPKTIKRTGFLKPAAFDSAMKAYLGVNSTDGNRTTGLDTFSSPYKSYPIANVKKAALMIADYLRTAKRIYGAKSLKALVNDPKRPFHILDTIRDTPVREALSNVLPPNQFTQLYPPPARASTNAPRVVDASGAISGMTGSGAGGAAVSPLDCGPGTAQFAKPTDRRTKKEQDYLNEHPQTPDKAGGKPGRTDKELEIRRKLDEGEFNRLPSKVGGKGK